MDPNVTLRITRQLVARIRSREPATAADLDAHELAGCMEDIDEWLSRGGFLPDDWSRTS